MGMGHFYLYIVLIYNQPVQEFEFFMNFEISKKGTNYYHNIMSDARHSIAL